ncbi:MAG: hypothetical protein KKB81_01575 [Candidatus Margulisbacteria bacterium]|nr:hypothetical protein [Candidatus Margulisiibacteriota bacterium]MBU1021605.1 hypothetical protein [Candidatus Margulisiibacteriota bacterium]MBU1728756.1 hypothetical protein [Candidatus Margulisiibacteriota bacterium]MBU1955722.1 hypothetical protein [Candidatus Margulisiibacteriota bacterium]
MINNPWLVGIGTPLISAFIIGLISWLKRDLPDKNVSFDWPNEYGKEIKLTENSFGWARFDEYEAKGFKPVYFYPYKLWFRQRIRYKEMILVYGTKNQPHIFFV